MTEIIAQDTYEVWKKLVAHVLQNGNTYTDRRSRVCVEELVVRATITQPQKTITKPIQFLSSLDKWIYPPLEEIQDSIFSSKTEMGYEYSLAARIFSFQGIINQIDSYIIPLLQKNHLSRQATITFVDPQHDFNVHKVETPSLVCIDCKIRDNKLHICAFVRSSDIFIGWPANIYQLFLIQEYIAKKIGVTIGALTTICASAHLFLEYKKEIDKLI